MVVQLLPFKLVAQVSLRFLHVHTHHSAQVSLCLQMDCHLVAALENSLVGSGPFLSLVSLYSMRQNFNPTLDSPGRLKYPNVKKSFALRSVGFLKPNMPTSISPPQPLLWSSIPEFSSTWYSPFQLKEMAARDVEKFMVLNKRRRWFRSSRVKPPFGQHVRKLVLGVNILDLDFGVQVNSVKQPVKKQLCGFWTRVSSSDFVL